MRGGGEIPGRHAARKEDVDLVGGDHLPIDVDGFLRVRLVVLDDDDDLASENAACLVHGGGAEFHAISPSAVTDGVVAGETSRNADLENVVLGANGRRRKRCYDCKHRR